MRRLSVMFMVSVVIVTFSLFGLAYTRMSAATQMSAAGTPQIPETDHGYSMGYHTYQGQVMSYDQTGNTMIVNGRTGETTFDISKAKVNGTIQPNETVVVRYGKYNGQMAASSVKVIEPKGLQKAEAANPSIYAANDVYPYAYPYRYRPGHEPNLSGTCAVTGCGIGGTPATLGQKAIG